MNERRTYNHNCVVPRGGRVRPAWRVGEQQGAAAEIPA
nr:MAG TPA: hypothetical protein [Caudoviricetes sp.]